MTEYPKVTIGVILYKNEKYLKYSLGSLTEQDYPNIELLVRDQSPHGEAYDFIKKELPDIYDYLQIEKGENLHHSGGHNRLIKDMTGEYYFCCSNDMYYPQDFVSNVVRELEKEENKKYGTATCKLLIWDFEKIAEHHNIQASKTHTIDSCGLGLSNNHFFYDIGQGEHDKHQYDHKHNVFGPSGALAIYRKSSLDDIKYKDEYFDELIHYKNDIDLAYRLQWSGWPCKLLPEIKVYHDRQATNVSQSPFRIVRIIKNRKAKSKWTKENSFFGQQVVLIKNFSNKYSKLTKLRTLLHQWGTLLFSLVFEPYLLKQVKKVKTHEKEIIKKRDAIQKKVSPTDIEKLMSK